MYLPHWPFSQVNSVPLCTCDVSVLDVGYPPAHIDVPPTGFRAVRSRATGGSHVTRFPRFHIAKEEGRKNNSKNAQRRISPRKSGYRD